MATDTARGTDPPSANARAGAAPGSSPTATRSRPVSPASRAQGASAGGVGARGARLALFALPSLLNDAGTQLNAVAHPVDAARHQDHVSKLRHDLEVLRTAVVWLAAQHDATAADDIDDETRDAFAPAPAPQPPSKQGAEAGMKVEADAAEGAQAANNEVNGLARTAMAVGGAIQVAGTSIASFISRRVQPEQFRAEFQEVWGNLEALRRRVLDLVGLAGPGLVGQLDAATATAFDPARVPRGKEWGELNAQAAAKRKRARWLGDGYEADDV